MDSSDVTLHCDSMAFMDLTCGRINPEGPIAAGQVTWSGDAELGAHAARNLRFTM
ncbi:SCP2 sterol-binding domain-containing protein [Candidatus Poriferisodalis sp.]|uniref:SCP2 sterol-binding domain-containing protein n=1 Tax=Candidatus Poriferisodalis sp. TaxID=3101277 RepID=UPI003B0104F7